jgi:hypothetical protein
VTGIRRRTTTRAVMTDGLTQLLIMVMVTGETFELASS